MARSTSPTRNLEWIAKLMDSQFRIPGTDIRFGLDAIIGLIPGGGDFATFLISAMMVSTMAKRGASGYLVARMTVNIVIDALIGAIPIIGDIFDFAFKANERNLKLMKEHYHEGKHKGSASRVVVPLLLVLLIVGGFVVWVGYKIITWMIHAL
jgi:hypothetical protein